MFQLTTSYLTLTDAVRSFSLLKQPYQQTSCGRGKDATLFQKGQIIGLYEAKKTTKEISETTKIGLRTVQRFIITRKDSGEPSSSRKKCGRKKNLE